MDAFGLAESILVLGILGDDSGVCGHMVVPVPI